ncbi:hypothetical protein D9615_005996 [Tricholomella constricta]|uniref:C2H2-type domain-containing protein n=1 Tax=Tricholomella constricta TaxID=117010 RepID=A0A8H5H9B6_9AGAR|nr:hypothetical protein D9615_005996 [Tricholomella constricta]
MKPSAEDLPISGHFANYDHDKTLSRSFGESQGSLYPTESHRRHPTYVSPHHSNLPSQHYPLNAIFNHKQAGTAPTSYPESSQRTNARNTGNPYSPSYSSAGNGHFTDTIRLGAHAEPDLDQMPPTMSSIPQPIQSDRYLYHSGPSDTSSSHQRRIYDRHLLSNLERSSRCNPHYTEDVPEQLHPPLLLLPRNLSPEATHLEASYSPPAHSDSGGGVDRASYATFETDGLHNLPTPLHPPFQSSIPMRNDAGWSSASPPLAGAYDHAHLPDGSSSKMAQTQGSESPASPRFGLFSEPTDQVNADTAASSSSSKSQLQANPQAKKKKSKMHECEVCGKMFPRPSGLKTHMNTHNNLKPFPCGFAGCARTFTVRSNAKRHLRTHGVDTSVTRESAAPPYVVGFDTPTVLPSASAPHEMSQMPYKLRWMPPSLSSRTKAQHLTTLSDDDSEESDGGQEEEVLNSTVGWGRRRSALSIPFRAVVPSSSSGHDPHVPFEERDSYADAPLYPYHPSQFRILPGPAVASPQPNSAE